MRVLLCTLSVVLLLGTAIASSLVGDVVNDKCPISDQPVKDGVVVSTDGGALPEGTGTDGENPDAKPAKRREPYLLDVCAASGRPLDVKVTATT